MDLSGVEAHGTAKAPIVWDQDVILSFDLMVLRVFQEGGKRANIGIYQVVVSNFTFAAIGKQYNSNDLNTPKYWTWCVDANGNRIQVGDPYAQIDTSAQIPESTDGTCNYRDDRY